MTKAVTNTQIAEIQSTTKLQTIIEFLRRPSGASLDELASATAWQKHSLRGAISGALKKRQKLQISSTVIDGRGRVYRIGGPAPDVAAPVAIAGSNGGEVQS